MGLEFLTSGIWPHRRPVSMIRASERIEGGQEKREVPKVFKFEGEPDKPLLAFALKDGGPTNFLFPAIALLKEDGYPMYLYTTGLTRDKMPPPEGFVAVGGIEAIQPAVVVRTSADLKKEATRSLPLSLEDEWAAEGATFVDIDDYPGSSRIIGGRAPDVRLVAIDAARKEPVDVVTGSPAISDRYAHVSHLERRVEARAKLGSATDEFVITFSGQNPPATPLALKQVIRALNAVKTNRKIVLLFSRHPRDTETDYSDILGSFKKEKGRVILQSDGGLTSEEAGYAADLLVSTHSTEALASMHRRVPTLHVGLHASLLGKRSPYRDDYQHFDQPPFPVAAGASYWIPDGDKVRGARRVFEQAIDDSLSRSVVIEKAKEAIKINSEDPDGKSARRVRDAIIEASGSLT